MIFMGNLRTNKYRNLRASWKTFFIRLNEYLSTSSCVNTTELFTNSSENSYRIPYLVTNRNNNTKIKVKQHCPRKKNSTRPKKKTYCHHNFKWIFVYTNRTLISLHHCLLPENDPITNQSYVSLVHSASYNVGDVILRYE